jgi:hypothetical protein
MSGKSPSHSSRMERGALGRKVGISNIWQQRLMLRTLLRIAVFWQPAELIGYLFCTTITVESCRRLAQSGQPTVTLLIHSLFERRRKPWLCWCWLGFDFFYRGNIKDKVITLLHPVSMDDLPNDPNTCVFQFFQLFGFEITN